MENGKYFFIKGMELDLFGVGDLVKQLLALIIGPFCI